MCSYVSNLTQYCSTATSVVKNFFNDHPTVTKTIGAVSLAGLALGSCILFRQGMQIASEPAFISEEITRYDCPIWMRPPRDLILPGEGYTFSEHIRLTRVPCDTEVYNPAVNTSEACLPRICPESRSTCCEDRKMIPADSLAHKLRDCKVAGKAVVAGALGAIGYIVKKGLPKLVNLTLPDPEKANAWKKAAIGASCYPLGLLAGLSCAVAGSLLNCIDPVKSTDTLGKIDIPINILPLQIYAVSQVVASEELIGRVVIQGLLLKKGLSKCISLISPTLAQKNLTSTLAKTCRIGLSAALFSLAHLSNAYIMTQNDVNFQVANTFGLGLVLGYLQEKTNDAWASVGLHLAFNVLNTISLGLPGK